MPWSYLKRYSLIFFSFLLISLCCTTPGRSLLGGPVTRTVFVGDSLSSIFNVPPFVLSSLAFNTNHPEYLETSKQGPLVRSPGRLEVSLRLFGVIPLRCVTVSAIPRMEVVPAGQAIGVMLHCQGVMVVGQAPVYEKKGSQQSPAAAAGIVPGDILLKINGNQVINENDVRKLVNQEGRNGRPLRMELRRHKRVLKVTVNPVYCEETGSWRIGLLVRDSTAGIGTLTFYEPHTKRYGALGHVIADAQTSQAVQLTDGKIVSAIIQGLRPGRRGQPGEKLGVFACTGEISGSIDRNNVCGIFGRLAQTPRHGFYHRPLPVALAHQVHEGPAQMLTVLNEGKVERFSIEIERVRSGARRDGKGLVIRVTDPELLEQTGGIIQGMSGSPIVQNGYIVGAVTHVFINNPARGYGVLAQWMVEESGLVTLLQRKIARLVA